MPAQSHTPNDRTPVHKVIVVGGGSAGFLSALTLKTMLPQLDVTVVHATELPPIGVGESTTSLLPRFLHGGLGIDQREFYHAVRPSWKLGIRFEDWGAPGTDRFYYPFDEQANARVGTFGKEEAYSFFADRKVSSHYTALMDLGKSPCFPKPDGSVAMDQSFGYHIENRAFIQFLQTTAANRGIAIIDQAVHTVVQAHNGRVASLRLANDTTLTADLFVDCTGFSSQLLEKTLQEPFTSYQDSLFCDSAITGSWRRSTGVLPYTNCRTMDHGWCWNIEMTDRVSCGYVFSSKFCSPEAAQSEMRTVYPQLEKASNQSALEEALEEAQPNASLANKPVTFRSGRHERFWVNNVAAIGNAGGFVEPLESTGLHMITVTARTLGQALIDNDCSVTASMQRGLNNFIGQAWDDIRDCLAIHFAFNQTRDTPFWQHCRENTDLAGAQALVEFYRENGPSSLGANLIPRHSIFRHDGYLSILIGQQAPTTYTFDLPENERHQWQAVKRRVNETATHALSMDDGLRLAMSQ